jgi:hypothetical protein
LSQARQKTPQGGEGVSIELPKAPPLTFEAIGSGKPVKLAELGATALLICLRQQTAEQVGGVVSRVRQSFPDNAHAVIIRVVDLRGVSPELRETAEAALQAGYEKRVSRLEPGQNPTDYVTILADWSGAVADALALKDLDSRLGIAVFDRRGFVIGTYQGDDVAAAAISLVENARDASARP